MTAAVRSQAEYKRGLQWSLKMWQLGVSVTHLWPWRITLSKTHTQPPPPPPPPPPLFAVLIASTGARENVTLLTLCRWWEQLTGTSVRLKLEGSGAFTALLAASLPLCFTLLQSLNKKEGNEDKTTKEEGEEQQKKKRTKTRKLLINLFYKLHCCGHSSTTTTDNPPFYTYTCPGLLLPVVYCNCIIPWAIRIMLCSSLIVVLAALRSSAPRWAR